MAAESIYQLISKAEAEGEALAVCTITRASGSTPRNAGSKMVVFPGGEVRGTIGGGEMEARVVAEALNSLGDGTPRVLVYDLTDPGEGDPGVCGGQVEVFVEPILSYPTVVVVGGGHVGKAVAHLASWLDFKVAVSDDRPEFSTPEAVPAADTFHNGPLTELPGNIRINSRTYLVLCTRNVTIDVAGIPALLATDAAYIGVIGSRRRWETTRKLLQEAGIPEEALARITSPMGLELGAETPEEIAVSIMAEIIMMRRGGSGQPMS